MSISRKS